MKTSKFEIDMCNGSIMDKLISFSLPLMLSSILQLMFNAVDIIVVGRFDSSQALAAVGSTTALINIFTNLFIGISLGANVLAARYFAAGRDKEMSEAVHTAITLALISGIIMAFVGAAASRLALDLMDTPADVIDQSVTYMRIYFMGMPFFMLYNYGAAVLRAVGDTKRPLLFLAIAGVANVVLDLLLVIVIPLGVAGVAIGTVSSQFVSCILVLWYGDQFFQCFAPVVCQFIRLDGNGGLYGGKQCSGVPVCVSQCRHTGVHEFYQPELQCGKTETYGSRASGLHDSISGSIGGTRRWSVCIRFAGSGNLYIRCIRNRVWS